MILRNFLFANLLAGSVSAATIVRFETNVGDFQATLFDELAPITVANFLGYVRRGDYDNTIIHRSVSDFVIQGGGFSLDDFQVDSPLPRVEAQPPIPNEAGISNLRGTLAVARLMDPNSGTSQWFINLNDLNAPNLDAQFGGFAVFGEIEDLTVVDQIATLPIIDQGGPFSSLPVMDGFTNPLSVENYVTIEDVSVIPEPASGMLLSLSVLAIVICRRR